MKTKNTVLLISVLLLVSAATLAAADFGWMDNFNITARADPSGFHAQLAARFHLGDAQITAIIGDSGTPADAFMVLRCAELSGRPVDQVMREFQEGKGKGWGVIAKRLGIKPGSSEFKALKRGDDSFVQDVKQKGKDKDLRTDAGTDRGQGRGADTDRAEGRGHGQGKGH